MSPAQVNSGVALVQKTRTVKLIDVPLKDVLKYMTHPKLETLSLTRTGERLFTCRVVLRVIPRRHS